MKYYYFYIFWLLAQFLVAFFNFYSSKIWLNYKEISFFLFKFSPVVFIYSLLFILYFWIWSQSEKFWILYIISISIWIIFSLAIQYFILKQWFSIYQIIGTLTIIIGIIILNYQKIFN